MSPRYFQLILSHFGLLVQEKKFKTGFLHGFWGHHLESDQNGFSYVWSTSHSNTFYQVWKQLALPLYQEKKLKIDFQERDWGGNIGYPIRAILGFSVLQVTQILSTKFQVDWHFVSGEEVQNRFSRRRLWRLSRASYRNNFSEFWSAVKMDFRSEFRLDFLFERF